MELSPPARLVVLPFSLERARFLRLLVLELPQLRAQFVTVLGEPPLEGGVRLPLLLEVRSELRQLLDLRLLELQIVLGRFVEVDEFREVGLGLNVFL